MTETWLVYDDGVRGHHPGFLDRIVEASQSLGLRVLVASPVIPPSLLDRNDWMPVKTSRLRQIARNRATMETSIRWARRKGVDGFLDLFLDKNVWSAGAARQIPRRVHILHRAGQYDLSTRQGAARARTKFLRARLKRLTSKDAVVVVHTDRAADILGSAVAPDRLLRAALPVGIPDTAPRPAVSRPPVVLFAGAARREKGLDHLLQAISMLPKDLVTVRVVGSQPDGLVASLEKRFPGVEATWIDRFVTQEQLQGEFRRADLVVLPYQREFRDHGGASSVLLEALAHGRAIVTTPALESQLPFRKRGSVVACSDSPQDLATAIDNALSQLGEMVLGAIEDGPRFVAQEHSYDTYVRALRDVLTEVK